MSKYRSIGIYGGGGFGTALACHVARCYKSTKLFLRDLDVFDEIQTRRTNFKYLGNILIPNNVFPTINISDILDFEVLIIAVPSKSFIDTLLSLKNASLCSKTVLLIATKGFGINPTALLSDKIKLIFPKNPSAFIAGPNLAREIACGLFTTVTIASNDLKVAKKLENSLISSKFSINSTDAFIAIQVAGALKNIIAIKSGLYDRRNYGQNAKASLIIRGLEEIGLLSEVMGEKMNNQILCFPGVLGDLVLTCYSNNSRNYKFGYELAVQKDIKKFLAKYQDLVEGVYAIRLVLDLIKEYNILLPIVHSIAEELEML